MSRCIINVKFPFICIDFHKDDYESYYRLIYVWAAAQILVSVIKMCKEKQTKLMLHTTLFCYSFTA